MLVDALQVNGVGVVMAEQRPKESDEEKEQKDYASDDGGFVFYKSLKYLCVHYPFTSYSYLIRGSAAA